MQKIGTASEESQPTGFGSGIRHRNRLSLIVPVVLTVVPVLLHYYFAFAQVKTGVYQLVPTIYETSEDGIAGWFTNYKLLYIKPETAIITSRLLAMWVLVLLVLAVYLALQSGQSLPSGIGSFLAYGLSALVMLAVIAPAAWYAFGRLGPMVVEFVPPTIFTLVTLLMIRSAYGPSQD